MKQILALTGAAGSGLSSSEYVLEELGYVVIKNVPAPSINKVIDDFFKYEKTEKVCFIVHAVNATEVIPIIKDRKDVEVKVVALTCEDKELQKRYTLTRKVHPRCVVEKCSGEEAIKKDVASVTSILEFADYSIDTTSISVKQLRSYLYKILANYEEDDAISVTFISFGLKNGIPQGLDMFFDVRNIPNPYWVDELKALTGEDKKVIDYMNSFAITKEIIEDIKKYLTTHLANVKKSKRVSYVVGIACSGGQHRSTYVANTLAKYFATEYRTSVIHRDSPELNKDEI